MADFETHDERRACVTAFDGDSRQISYETFKAGWIASRAWHRERNEREIEAAAARLLERQEARMTDRKGSTMSAEVAAAAERILREVALHADTTEPARDLDSTLPRFEDDLVTVARCVLDAVEWQEGEQETLRALAAGEGRTFRGAREAIQWLLSEDE